MEAEEESKLGLSLGVGQCQFAPIYKQPKKHKQEARFHLSFPPHMKEETHEEAEHMNSSNKRGTRKKLMLTNRQVMFLEESFREHSILTQIKKNDLAAQLHLQPRQIEVWYQNRRARSKLKQKETDCEFWKTLSESLREENKRLKTELQDLKSRYLESSSYVNFALTVTSSFDKRERRKEW